MFTLEQIIAAHSKVKSGADFPFYIKEIKSLGVTQYQAYVEDGRVDYHGANQFMVKAPSRYESLAIADTANIHEFTSELKAHQQGKTNYLEFITMCAKTGIEKWEIHIDKMTCTYFDKAGNQVLEEEIPNV